MWASTGRLWNRLCISEEYFLLCKLYSVELREKYLKEVLVAYGSVLPRLIALV